MADKTGGPAFPIDGGQRPWAHGMSLRDYFAAQALGAILAHDSQEHKHGISQRAIATAAYSIADYMIAERSK